MLIALGGYSGTGKTTLGHALQRAIACPSILICPDMIRMDILGLSKGSSITNHHITPEVTQQVVEVMSDITMKNLAASVTVIIPSAFLAHDMRHRFAQIAQGHHLPFLGFWLSAPDDVLIERIETRQMTSSDCHVTPEILKIQKQFASPGDWINLDAIKPTEENLSIVLHHIQQI